MRPACRSVRDRCRESDAAMRSHSRTACVEAATQPRDVCAAGMRNGRDAGRTSARVCTVLATVVSRLPRRHRRSNGSTPRPAHASGRRLSLRGDHRESEAQSFRSDPWAAVRRAKARSYATGPGFGDGNPPGFSARNAGKSQKLRKLSPGRTGKWKASEGVSGQPNVNHSHRVCARLAAL